MIKAQKGFSLLEVFVALAIGLVLLAGVLSVFVGMKTTTSQTSSNGELQENGRFAISVLSDDLLRQDFWGDYTGTFSLASINPVPGAPGNDCNGGGVNNSSFPSASGHFRTLWGESVTSANPMGCFGDAKKGSDVIQLKRVISIPVAPAAGAYYLTTNINEGAILLGAAAVIKNSQSWQYQHHVYYIREETQGSNNKVPVLMQGQLTTKMTFAPIIDGIEMIRFMYGVDTDIDPTAAGYGVVDAFISADNMTQALWDNAGGTKIIAVKVFVLARNVLPDNKYTNTNTYFLGDLNNGNGITFNDNYRRLLFSSTITLYNARVDSW